MEILTNVRKRKPNSEPLCCPICGITLRQQEIEAHYQTEMEKLSSCSPNRARKLLQHSSPPPPLSGCSSSSSSSILSGTDVKRLNGNSNLPVAGSGNTDETEEKRMDKDACWGTYQKIRTNRQKRLKIKPKKRKNEGATCPVCNEQPNGDINVHVDRCLQNSETQPNGTLKPGDSDDESIDVEGETFDEYEWSGQTRIRASSMLPGGYAAAGVGTSITLTSDDEHELNVDGDDTQIYGPPQFSERSIVPISKDKSNSYLRELVIGNEPPTTFQLDDAKEGSSSAASEHEEAPVLEAPEPISAQLMTNSDSNLIIEALKTKIREYERYIQNKPKCLICLSDFKKPVVSICCWHVYCQDCWLNSLGSRKLCPQCNMITSATDLRRIYL